MMDRGDILRLALAYYRPLGLDYVMAAAGRMAAFVENAPGAFARERAEAEPALPPSASGAGMDAAAAPMTEGEPQSLPTEGSAAPQPAPAPRKSGWSAERRAAQAERMRARMASWRQAAALQRAAAAAPAPPAPDAAPA